MSNTTVVDKDGLLQQAVSPDVETLSPTTPEVISRQATLNVGTIGHVAHGKSTLVRAISGVHPVRFADELKRNLTIKLGYANAKLFKCPKCPRPECFVSKGSATKHNEECPNKDCDGILELQRHVSFVDCPGHDILMATMLNGAAVMDAALLLVAGNESCPQPQTSEHLAAIEIMQLKHLIILQNKIDLVRRESAVQQHQQIREFVKGTCASDSPIIPISAQLGYNVDVLVEYMIKHIPIPDRDFSSTARMILIRSFDVNLPGCSVDKLRGGVAGGSLLQGILKLGDQVEIRPGVVVRNPETQKIVCTPIRSSIVSLLAEDNHLKYAIPGGLIGVGTNVDPMLCRSDRLVGQVLGKPGNLPQVFIEIEVSFYLLRRLLGVKTNGGKASRVTKIANGEVLMLNIGSTATGGRVTAILGSHAKFSLTSLVCTQSGEKIAISRRVDKHWRLIGWGTIVRGVENEIMVE